MRYYFNSINYLFNFSNVFHYNCSVIIRILFVHCLFYCLSSFRMINNFCVVCNHWNELFWEFLVLTGSRSCIWSFLSWKTKRSFGLFLISEFVFIFKGSCRFLCFLFEKRFFSLLYSGGPLDIWRYFAWPKPL